MSRLGLRRRLLGGLAAGGGLALLPAAATAMPATPTSASRRLSTEAATLRLAELEVEYGGRLGVSVLDTGSGLGFGWRDSERFALCSTFKLPLAALVLREHADGRLDGHAPIALDRLPDVPHQPAVDAARAAGRTHLSPLELAQATQTTSDNLAANLLLLLFDGPQGFTARLRALGETDLRVDRWEPEINEVPTGEQRDTVSPRGMARLCARLFGPGLLDASSQRVLAHWMIETRTGLKRLRAGLPPDWRIGDKTGTAIGEGFANKHNDVAIAWPPRRPPTLIAAYYEADAPYPLMRPQDDAVLAEVGRIVSAWLA
jgi:beta-lactamase class A